MNETSGPGQNPGLHCFGGSPAPPSIIDGWRGFLALLETNQEGVWSLFESVLRNPGDPGYEERVRGFSQERGLLEAQVLLALQAFDTLFHQAAAFDLSREQFGQDLSALSGGPLPAVDPLLSHYDGLKGELRGRILQETLADHGKVLLGLDWRIDKVISSDRGTDLDGSVMLLTLRYREGDRLDRVTLQLTPDALADLKRFAERIQG